ncbi:MAG TPA: hypothetical protein VGC67_09775 [Cellulomonas sp.]
MDETRHRTGGDRDDDGRTGPTGGGTPVGSGSPAGDGTPPGRRAGPLPMADRSPADGQLFDVELVYLLQTQSARDAHARRLAAAVAHDLATVHDLTLELRDRAGADLGPAGDDPGWCAWHRDVGRTLADVELRARRRAAEDHLLRAYGQLGLSTARFEALLARRPAPPPHEL